MDLNGFAPVMIFLIGVCVVMGCCVCGFALCVALCVGLNGFALCVAVCVCGTVEKPRKKRLEINNKEMLKNNILTSKRVK